MTESANVMNLHLLSFDFFLKTHFFCISSENQLTFFLLRHTERNGRALRREQRQRRLSSVSADGGSCRKRTFVDGVCAKIGFSLVCHAAPFLGFCICVNPF